MPQSQENAKCLGHRMNLLIVQSFLSSCQGGRLIKYLLSLSVLGPRPDDGTLTDTSWVTERPTIHWLTLKSVYTVIFSSYRSSRNTNLRPFFQGYLSETRNLHLFGSGSLQEHSELSESNQTASYNQSLKHFVLFCIDETRSTVYYIQIKTYK